MHWNEIRIDRIGQLVETLINYEDHWVFRGQADASWDLTSSLERVLAPLEHWIPEFARKAEELSLQRFQSQARLYMFGELHPTTLLSWLAFMQHHGVPTRLLDMTESPFVALFFALEDANARQYQSSAIWALDYRELNKKCLSAASQEIANFEYEYADIGKKPDDVFGKLASSEECSVAIVVEPFSANARLARQSGTFLVSTNVEKMLRTALNRYLDTASLHKIVIPNHLIDEALKTLGKMSVDNSHLFGDIDGFARDVRGEIQQLVWKTRHMVTSKNFRSNEEPKPLS